MISLPNYTVLEKIYEGSHSAIYRARRDVDSCTVAIKVLKNEYPSLPEIARFKREFAILQSLKLPGIVGAYALEKFGNGAALITEYLKGQPLIQLMRQRRLELSETLHIAVALADLLDSVHRLRVIHKDLKPHNVIVELAPFSVHLIDFGTATRLSAEVAQPAEVEELEGTLAYMPPEQTGRMNRKVDARADLYSLGITLYEMLTGVLPFSASDPMELIHSHLTRTPPAPRLVDPTVPEPVSDLVMKLLYKAPEERYQTAYGLASDLKECLRRWQTTNQIAPFPLGKQDRSDELRLPNRLYGRQTEVHELKAAFDRISHGGAELVLVAGYSGIGKTALVAEVHKPILHRGGYFLAGKFDQLSRSAPYSAVAQALRQLVNQLLGERSETLAVWKRTILGAVGNNGALLTDLIPELALVIGPQPSMQLLGAAESQNRFNVVLLGFLHVFMTAEHPLVLFLDDLQWADAASLKLLQTLLCDPQRGYLLILGSYRDQEVAAGHPFALFVEELHSAHITYRELKLAELTPQDVLAMVNATLGFAPELPLAEPLAKVVYDKTHGNPFFMGQFLELLYREKLLRFELSAGRWVWNLEDIARLDVTDNVVDLMAKKIQRLAEATQNLLELAACIGFQFDLRALALIGERPPAETAVALWPAIQEGLLVPLDTGLRFRGHPPDGDGGSAALDNPSSHGVYRFIHDRVQQAAYSLIADDRKQAVHLRIGRLLLGRCAFEEAPSFDVIDHLNLGSPLITESDERLALAEMNLNAAQRAKAATAYKAAAAYLNAGTRLLPDGFAESYELFFALNIELAECEYLNGRLAHAERLLDLLTEHATTNAQRGRVCILRTVAYASVGRFADGIGVCLGALRMFGINYPDNPAERPAALQAEFAKVGPNMGGRSFAEILANPQKLSEDGEVISEILTATNTISFLANPELFPWVVTAGVNFALQHGHNAASTFNYLCYGYILSTALERYEEALQFGLLSLELGKKFKNASMAAKVAMVFGTYRHFYKHLREGLVYYESAYQLGMEGGDFLYASLSRWHSTIYKLSLGYELKSLAAETAKNLTLMKLTRDSFSTNVLTVFRQMIANLQGNTFGKNSLSDASFDETAFLAGEQKNNAVPSLVWYYVIKLQLTYLHEDWANADALITASDPFMQMLPGLHLTSQLSFWISLIVLALPEAADVDKRQLRQELFARHQGRINQLALLAPMNYRHQELLIAAEQARGAHRYGDAMSLYEQAIDAASQNEFMAHIAVANELAARFHLSRGRVKLAAFYMREAHYGYRQWGASSKVSALEDRYSQLLDQDQLLGESVRIRSSSTTSPRQVSDRLLDVSTVMRAAQAIASEIVVDKVIDQLMRIVLTNAGAQSGLLIADRSGRLVIEAAMRVEPDQVQIGLSVPIESSDQVAVSVVQFVARSHETVVIGNATADSRFLHDPYLVRHRPKSILCLALMNQGRLLGVLYLENNAVYDAFSVQRIELLRLLSAQAAVAIENARLYSHEQESGAKLQRANEALELQVNQRTAALQAATEQLLQSNQRLQAELAEREQVEKARAALSAEIIQVQNARLAEMSAPLIPITDQIMVLPLIGAMDAQRARQVLETVLLGAQASRARVVIVDITGITYMDTSVAGTLINLTTALRLLGTQAVLTGIRSDMAQVLVKLGIDMQGIVTRSTLQSGIAYAIAQVGEIQLAPNRGGQNRLR